MTIQDRLKSAYFRIEKIWLHIKNELMNEGNAVFTGYQNLISVRF